MHSMQVRDVMSRQFPRLELGASLSIVVEQLQEYNLTGAPVIDQHNQLKRLCLRAGLHSKADQRQLLL